MFEAVVNSIVAVLAVQADAITPGTHLIGDLGAESIDFLDLSCEIERRTGKQLHFRNLLQAKRQASSEDTVDLTVADVARALEELDTSERPR